MHCANQEYVCTYSFPGYLLYIHAYVFTSTIYVNYGNMISLYYVCPGLCTVGELRMLCMYWCVVNFHSMG